MDDCENKIIKLNKIEPHHGHDCVDISNNTQSKNEDQTMNKEDENNKTQECVKENNDVKIKENNNEDTQCNECQNQQVQMKIENKPSYLEQLIALDLNNTKKEDVIKLLMQNSIKSSSGYQTQSITFKDDKGGVTESKQEVKRKESEKQQIDVVPNNNDKDNTNMNKEQPKTENANNEIHNKENEAKTNENVNVNANTNDNANPNENVNANTNENVNANANTNENTKSNTNNINGIYSKTGKYHIFKEPNNPEYINDFNTAVHRIKNKLNADDKKDLLTQLLCFDPNPKSNQVQYDLSANAYEEKYKGIIAKKQENIEKTIQKYNDDYKDIYTFMPSVNKLPNDQRRNIEQFIEDQKRFTEKKQKRLQDKLQQKQIDTIEQTKPKKQRPLTKTEQNELYDRLYKNINRYKPNPKDNNTNTNNKPTSPSKVQKKKPNLNSALYQTTKQRQCSKSPLKVHSSSLHSESILFNNILLKQTDISTYKILMSSFLEKFRDVASTLLQIKQSSTVIVDNNIKSSSPRDLYQLENLSFQKLLDFMTLLGMLTKSSMHSPLGQSIDSTIHQNEKKLLFILFDSLKTEHNVIQLEHLKKFLFAVLGLHSFALYEEFKIKHKVNEIDQLLKNENIPKKTQQCVDFMIKTQNDENTSRIDVNHKQNNKYVSYTNSNELIISLAQAKKIRSDFSIFSISYMSNRKRRHKHNTNINNENEYDDYNDDNNEIEINDKEEIKEEMNNEGFESEQMEHFARLAMMREKKIMEMQRLKDESEKQLMKECTFQPNVKYNNKSSTSPNNHDKKYNKQTGINKSIELYQQSKDKNVLKKQNRTKDESEYERHKHEYTFTPNTKQTFPSVSSSNTSNDFNSKSYTLFFERMKNGKADRMVKDAVQDRYGLDESLKAYIKYNKHKENNNSKQVPSSTQSCYYTNTEYAYYNNNKHNNRKNKSAGKIGSKVHQHQQVESEEEEEFTESVPLLIIDVNIKQGVKKKLLVYEKDTPEDLADKFAKENNLDNQTKEKLQTLIRNHMQRLLTRIDEENPTSIKSTVNSNQQIKTDI